MTMILLFRHGRFEKSTLQRGGLKEIVTREWCEMNDLGLSFGGNNKENKGGTEK